MVTSTTTPARTVTPAEIIAVDFASNISEYSSNELIDPTREIPQADDYNIRFFYEDAENNKLDGDTSTNDELYDEDES